MADDIVFDHLAVASEHAIDQFWRYYAELGGTFLGGGTDPGFHFWQLQYPSGMRIELLEDDPGQPEDFLRRFLDRNGPGPHHLTFKVPELGPALQRVERAGYRPVGVDVSNPEWQQAFLHPKEAPGVVIQLACAPGGEDLGGDGTSLPLPRTRTPADLERVVLLVADLDRETRLFTEVLAGQPADRSADDLGPHVDMTWPDGGCLRLTEPTEPAARHWLGDRSGRVHHAAFAVADATTVSWAAPVGEGVYEVAPEHNLGLRLRLSVRQPPV
jgi:catechol 2,3-dioxygenase-like lactoylglutathione lyase family enzyme